MTILFITHYDNLYGANNALLKLAKQLKCDGAKVIIAGPLGSGELKKELEKLDIQFLSCSMTQWQAIYTSYFRFFVKKIKRSPHILKEVDELYKLIENEKIDIIHSNSSVIVHGALLAERLNAKHVWHIREFSKEHFNMHYFYNDEKVKELYTKSAALITISDALKDNYKQKYENANIIRIYDGVSEDMADENSNEAKERDYNKETVRFVYVGYLFEKKHQLEVIKACEKLYSEGYTNFEMHFIGDGKADYKKKLSDEISKSGLECIYLDGFVSNVKETLKTMDVGVIASEYEGFGLVTVEYMLSKMPVIGRAGGGTSEIIDNRKTGFVYSTEDEMVSAMKKIMDEPLLRKELGESGYKRAKTVFTEENNAKAIMQLYETVLSGETV